MNIEQIEYFVAIVEEGTISGAARRLNVSQPPVSLQIRNLEDEYGVKLFERGARQITLTEAGKAFYTYAQKILELKSAAEDDLTDIRRGRKGNLKIGIISSGFCEEFFKGVKQFHAKYPDIRFKIEDGNTYQQIDALMKGRIDLAVIRAPFLNKGLDTISLRKDPMTVAGTEDFFKKISPTNATASSAHPLHLSDLGETPLILYRRWEKIIRETAAAENFHGNYFCVNDDARTSLQWADAGLGLAIVPASSLKTAPWLLSRPLAEENLESEIFLVRRAGETPSELVRVFFESFRS